MICPHCGKSIDSVRQKEYAQSQKDYIEIHVVVERETEKAIGIDWNDDMIWLPKSQILDESGNKIDNIIKDTPVKIKISKWLAKEKGFLDDNDSTTATQEKDEDIAF